MSEEENIQSYDNLRKMVEEMMPLEKDIEFAKCVVKQIWRCIDSMGDNRHVLLSVGYFGDVDWTIHSLANGRFCGEDIGQLFEQMYPCEEERKKREMEAKKEELLRCENRANELRKELQLCEK